VAKTSTAPSWQRAVVILAGTVVGVVIILCLYWARTIFLPVALAAFLTFLLSPLVSALQRRGLGRAPSVLLVVLLAGLVLSGLVWLVTAQVSSLIAELPNYKGAINKKVAALRDVGLSPIAEHLDSIVQEVIKEPQAKSGGRLEGDSARPLARPPAVAVEPEGMAWLSRLPHVLSPVAEAFASAALTLVLAIFMLLKREDLRNRIIRLVGHGRITLTTKAVDDAGHRMSRFLLMQLLINGGFGLLLGLGLLALDVHYALLWGLLVGVMRYIPYIGTWLGAVLPLTLSLATSDGWTQPLGVFGLLLVLDLLAANVFEPWLFGRSIGVSEVALLVSAAFWAFLWGPIGMVLSNPLTVCLVVLGKYVPSLEFLDVILGDEPVLAPDVAYYQRLLARDQDEATELVLARVKESQLENVYDELLVPALNYVRRDRERDDLSEADEKFVLEGTREIVEDLGEVQAAAAEEDKPEATDGQAADGKADAERAGQAANGKANTAAERLAVLGCPAREQSDYLGLQMLQQLLDPTRWHMEITPVEMLSAELLQQVAEAKPTLVVIGALPPGGLAHTRYLCKRLRARFPRVKIVVGRWGLKGNIEQNLEQLKEAGADLVTTTLLETRNQVTAWLPVLTPSQAEAPRRAAV